MTLLYQFYMVFAVPTGLKKFVHRIRLRFEGEDEVRSITSTNVNYLQYFDTVAFPHLLLFFVFQY